MNGQHPPSASLIYLGTAHHAQSTSPCPFFLVLFLSRPHQQGDERLCTASPKRGMESARRYYQGERKPTCVDVAVHTRSLFRIIT